VRKARIASDHGSHPRQTKLMNVHAPKLLTPEEFASLIDVAMSPPEVNVPPILQRLVTLGYVSLTARGPLVTGDGLIRLPESEWGSLLLDFHIAIGNRHFSPRCATAAS